MNEFDSFVFPATVTTREVIEDRDVSVALDLRGITNRGLFLKSDEEERIFGRAECPCEVLFQVDASGKVTRMPEGVCVCVLVCVCLYVCVCAFRCMYVYVCVHSGACICVCGKRELL